jgi:hypothetical protein
MCRRHLRSTRAVWALIAGRSTRIATTAVVTCVAVASIGCGTQARKAVTPTRAVTTGAPIFPNAAPLRGKPIPDFTQPLPVSPNEIPRYVRYPGPRSVLGYRFALPPLVGVDDTTPHVQVDLYFRLNKPLQGSIGHVELTNVVGPFVNGQGSDGLTTVLGGGCYLAADIELGPTQAVKVGLIANVTLKLTANTPALQARVPMIAIPPKITELPGYPVPNVDQYTPYERLLGCPT